MKDKHNFGELEDAIMSVFLAEKRAFSVKEIQEALKSQRAYTTIMTVIHRLYKKKHLNRKKEGRSFSYYLQKPPKETKLGFLERFKNKLKLSSPSEAFSYFLDLQDNLSEKELKKIEKLIKNYKEKKRK